MKKIISCILIVAMVAVVFAGCANPQKKILGTWTGESTLLGIVAEYSFTFNADGTGKMTAAKDIGVSMTYTISEEKLSITTSLLGIDSTTDYTYSFDKDTLTLSDGSRTIVLTKQA
jgi:hypothetical protein